MPSQKTPLRTPVSIPADDDTVPPGTVLEGVGVPDIEDEIHDLVVLSNALFYLLHDRLSEPGDVNIEEALADVLMNFLGRLGTEVRSLRARYLVALNAHYDAMKGGAA